MTAAQNRASVLGSVIDRLLVLLWLPVALSAVSANASGRLAVAFGIASAAATGPSRSSL